MKVVVLIEGAFERTPDGLVWTRSIFPYSFWQRYLAVFDEVVAVSRVAEAVASQPDWLRADGDGVRVHALPPYRSMVGYLRHHRAISRAFAAALDQRAAVIMRIPSTSSECLERLLAADSRPYGAEVVSDPWDVFSPGAVRHPLRPLLRRYFSWQLRRQCQRACALSYVTSAALQDRYPPRADALSVGGASSVELPAEAFVARARTPRTHSPFNLIMVASLAQLIKAPDVLLAACALALGDGCDLRLVVVGDGKHRPELESQAAALGIGARVSFRGLLPAGAAVRAELDAADAFVLPSRQEGLPRAMIEAMARALPCIGSTVGGIPELLAPAMMVAPNDAPALARRIATLAGDPELQAGESARNLALAHAYGEDQLRARRAQFYQAVRTATVRWQEGLAHG